MSSDTPLKQRAGTAIAVAAVLQALFLFFFLVPASDPEPNGLPVAVAGPAAAGEQVEALLEQRGGDVGIVAVRDAGAALRAVEQREVYGAFVFGPERELQQVVVASGASAAVAEVLRAAAQAAGVERASVADVARLPEADRRGTAINILLIPLIVTSILAAIVSVSMVPDLDLLGRLGLFALAGVTGGLIAVGLAAGWLDVLPGPWLAEAGLLALTVTAVGLTSGGIIRILGPAATAVPFLLFLMLGTPASGAAGAPELLPTPWAQLGFLLPPGALADGLRGVAYFDGAATALPVLVLLGWLMIGVGLNALAGRRAAAPTGSAHGT